MIHEYKDRNKPSKETLFGWYPGGNEAPRTTPKDIYINLGSRPPRDQTYTESDLLYQYHQSIKPSERDFATKQTPEEAIKPPWSLHVHSPPNQAESDKDVDARYEAIKNLNRTKSAPAIPTHRIILKIPNAQLTNLFDADGELHSTLDKSNTNNNIESTSNNNNLHNVANRSSPSPTSPNPNTGYMNNNISYTGNLLDSILLIRGNLETNQTRPKSSFVPRTNTYEKCVKNENTEKTESVGNQVTVHYSSQSPTDLDEGAQFDQQQRAVKSVVTEVKTVKPTYRCKVIEVENFGKEPIVEGYDQILPTTRVKSSNSKLSRAKTASLRQKRSESQFTKQQRAQTATKAASNESAEFHYTITDYHRELQLASPDKKPITQTSSQLELAERFLRKVNLQTNEFQKSTETNSDSRELDVKVVEGHWKDHLLNREKYLQKRPKYHVRIDPEKVRSDPPAPEMHTNASETYFYNTLPYKRATFTINPHFISENLNVRKIGLQNRASSSSSVDNGPVKYRRNYAFVY